MGRNRQRWEDGMEQTQTPGRGLPGGLLAMSLAVPHSASGTAAPKEAQARYSGLSRPRWGWGGGSSTVETSRNPLVLAGLPTPGSVQCQHYRLGLSLDPQEQPPSPARTYDDPG